MTLLAVKDPASETSRLFILNKSLDLVVSKQLEHGLFSITANKNFIFCASATTLATGFEIVIYDFNLSMVSRLTRFSRTHFGEIRVDNLNRLFLNRAEDEIDCFQLNERAEVSETQEPVSRIKLSKRDSFYGQLFFAASSLMVFKYWHGGKMKLGVRNWQSGRTVGVVGIEQAGTEFRVVETGQSMRPVIVHVFNGAGGDKTGHRLFVFNYRILESIYLD
jgi:hypothetical protein